MLLNVLVTFPLSKYEIEYLKEMLPRGINLIVPKEYNEKYFIEHIESVDVILGDTFTEDLLKRGKKLKLIQIPMAGTNRVNFDLLKGHDIPICNSHSNALIVVEFTFALIFSLGKKIPYHDRLMRKNNWNRDRTKWEYDYITDQSDYITGKTFGFIGYGNIGRTIGKLLMPFNPKINIIVNDKNKNYPEVNFVGDFDNIDYVLEESDYLIIAVPLNNKTRGIINSDNITKMKSSAYLVNVSRGSIVEEKALYNALKDKTIAGAAIDTWYNYPKGDDGIAPPGREFDFTELDNIVLSPHRAAQLKGGFPYFDDAIFNLIKLSKNEFDFKNIIDPKKGY